jgi:XTP/dITP diphosphohydrolase
VTFLVATRSPDKLTEIRELLRDIPGVRLVDLDAVGVPRSDAEEGIEVFETFSENAVAKARYFQRLTGMPTIADDSGLTVDVLGGRPGVRSRRFAPGTGGLDPEATDRENNRYLLELLEALPDAGRSARYVCAAALDMGSGEPIVFVGEARGVLLSEPRGRGGFGYDPLFLDPGDGRTFAELSSAEKGARSHRGAAFRKLATHLSDRLGAQEPSASFPSDSSAE